ncbi:MAG TPA: hypothetical protein EYP53_00835 [Candidatus Latescibacteria bacterium]|nr:hypothetical protein [Candidatus Latescibacterota bacterium]
MQGRKPKAVLVPFGYPGYPDSYLERFTEESVEALKGLGIELRRSAIVKVRSDAAEAVKALKEEDFDFLIVLILSWLEAPNVIDVVDGFPDVPILLWSHTMFKENGEWMTLGPMPGAGVIRQTFEELGLNFKFVYGMPDEEKVRREIGLLARAASVVYRLRHSTVGLLGYASMGMYTACFDHLPLREKLGVEVQHMDQYVAVKRIEEMEDEQVERLVKEAKEIWEIGQGVTDRDLIISLKMYRALKDLVEEFGWSALQIKCQYELSKHYKSVPCIPLSMLGNEVPSSCEGDILLIVTQLMLHYLMGGIASYGDIHTVEEDRILVGACGYAPFGLCDGRPKVDKTEVLYEGVANCSLYKEGRVTLARLGYRRDRSLKMHIVTGEAKKPRPFREVGCLPYPSMEVVLDGKGDNVAQNLASQHYAIAYGDFREELLELCNLLSIAPKIT